MKRPAFQFYPADWVKDPALASCSLSARGLWVAMLCLFHECEPYGHLAINGNPVDDETLARMVGERLDIVKEALRELDGAGVFSRNPQGILYSRRMVRDEIIRNLRAEGGKLGAKHGEKGSKYGKYGGRPSHKTPLVLSSDKTPLDKIGRGDKKPPPSSSSSSSSAVAVESKESKTHPVASKNPKRPDASSKRDEADGIKPTSATTPIKRSRMGKERLLGWQAMITHITASWEAKRKAKMMFLAKHARLLHRVATTYTCAGAMALWDAYLRSDDDWVRERGWNVETFLGCIPRLVDDPGWKSARDSYINAGAAAGSLANSPPKPHEAHKPDTSGHFDESGKWKPEPHFKSTSSLADGVLTKLGVV